MGNSLIVAVLIVVLNLLIGVPAAYALAKVRFRGRQAVLYGVLTTRVVPDIALVVPFFLVIRAAERYREGVDLMLSTWPGAAEVIDEAITADPDFALAHAARARLHVLRSEGALAKERIGKAVELVTRCGSQRERSHVAALSLAINGRSAAAARNAS